MTSTERELLLAILAETRRVESLSSYREHHANPTEWGRRYSTILDLPEIGVRVLGSWVGGSEADRKARQRGLRGLESTGLVELFAAHQRSVTNVKLTSAGRTLAERTETEGLTDDRPT